MQRNNYSTTAKYTAAALVVSFIFLLFPPRASALSIPDALESAEVPTSDGVGGFESVLGDIGGFAVGGLESVLGDIGGFAGGTLGEILGGRSAEVPTSDTVQRVIAENIRTKEFGFDVALKGMAVSLSNAMLRQLIDWVITGRDGNPFYVTNIQRYLSQTRNREFDAFLSELEQIGVSRSVQRSVAGSQGSFEQSIRPTLSRSEIDEFEQDFSNGGWGRYIAFASPQNNNFGQFLVASNEAEERQKRAEEAAKEETEGGYIPQKECPDIENPSGFQFTGPIGCPPSEGEMVTPASTIKEQVNFSLTTGSRELLQADEVGEVVMALAQIVFQQVFGGGRGLSGAGEVVNTPAARAENIERPVRGFTTAFQNILEAERQYRSLKNTSLSTLGVARDEVLTLTSQSHISFHRSMLGDTNTSPHKTFIDNTLSQILSEMARLKDEIAASDKIIESIEQSIAALNSAKNEQDVLVENERLTDILERAHNALAVAQARDEFDTFNSFSNTIRNRVKSIIETEKEEAEQDTAGGRLTPFQSGGFTF